MRQDADDPDRRLVHDIATGDSTALDELYQRYGLSLFKFLISRLADRPLAEEVLQDVMLAIWNGANRFRGDSSVHTWIFAIAQRQLSKAYRRFRPYTKPLDETLYCDTVDCPHLSFERIARREAMQTALTQLPMIQQQAIELVFYAGLSGQEAADRLGIPVNTLKSHLFRARLKLRELLQKEVSVDS